MEDKNKNELVQLELGANNENIDPRHTVNFNENFWTNGILFHAYNLFHKKNIKGAINHLLPLLYNMGMIFYSHAIFSFAFGS